MERDEIRNPVSVLDESGGPVNFGWARTPLFFYNPVLIRAPQRHVFGADRYIVFSPTHLIVFEISDGGYLGHISLLVISLKDHRRFFQSFVIPFSLGSIKLPHASDAGSLRFQRKNFRLDFIVMESGARIIKVDIPKFGHRHLRGELVLSAPAGAESMVIHMPWRGEKNAFRYSRSSPWYYAEGVIQFGGAELVFTRDNAWGMLDWIRGVRPRADVHYWAAACGLSENRLVGFNVGYGLADSSMGTENAFFLDGKLHKLDQVTFHIPPSNWLEPWRFTSNDRRLEMNFVPHQEQAEVNRILLYSLKRRQVCGSFSGRVVLDGGEELEFSDITGFAERRKTKH
jgi:hypothetical protein